MPLRALAGVFRFLVPQPARAALAAGLVLPVVVCADDHWSGSLRNKIQVDNRYSLDGRFFGESWGQLYYDNEDLDLHAALDGMGRLSDLQNDSRAKLYQAYVRKDFKSLDSSLRLGRLQRTDNLGFYYLDGGDYRYSHGGLSVNFYVGRPGRIDHVLSVHGDSLYGGDVAQRLELHWDHAWSPVTVDILELRAGYQRFKYRQAVDRFNLGFTATGRLGGGNGLPYEGTASGTYRTDRGALENVWMSGQLDLTGKIRLRSSYEEYRPRNPFPTFRERFYTSLALGHQTLLKSSFHIKPSDDFGYYFGGQRATRGRGDDGYGVFGGASVKPLPGASVSGEVNYLELGKDRATSFYLSGAYSPGARWRVHVNTALRFENKQLYGENRAVGGELEVQYMFRNDLIFSAAGSHIWNTRINDEYLGAVQMIYYFDNFKPKPL